jgi:ERCC4-type nuclease
MKAAAAPFVVLCDTREQAPPPMPDGVVLERATLHEGDYSTSALLTGAVAVIERKSVSDFCSTLSHGRERFDREVQRLQAYKWKCIVVEGDLSAVYRATAMHPHSILGSIASLYARWDVPTLFAANEAGCGRLIAGLLRRWQERWLTEQGSGVGVPASDVGAVTP